jgi:hypothetical protein
MGFLQLQIGRNPVRLDGGDIRPDYFGIGILIGKIAITTSVKKKKKKKKIFLMSRSPHMAQIPVDSVSLCTRKRGLMTYQFPFQHPKLSRSPVRHLLYISKGSART